MKPMGPIPTAFKHSDGHLLIDGRRAEDLAAQTPCFVYSKAMLDAQFADLRAAMPRRLSIHYAMKANPFGPLIAHMNGLVDGFDIASGGELALAMAAGVDPKQISFAGPGKRDAELWSAIGHGVTLNAESEGEVARGLAIAADLGKQARIAIRVNPSFDLKGSGMKMGGGAKQFGVDAERVPALARAIIDAGAEWRGFHIYAGSQALKADAIIESQSQSLALSAELARAIGANPARINLGGGFGIPYFPSDEPLNIQAIGAALSQAFDTLPRELADTHFCIELGRYLVGEAGVYLTRVIDRKISHGEVFLITDGGLHHQLAASGNFGTVVRRNYPIAIANRMGAAEEVQTVVGCLCTPLDLLGNQVSLPSAQRGDLVAIFCAGAYGASASPAAFLGQGPAAELLV